MNTCWRLDDQRHNSYVDQQQGESYKEGFENNAIAARCTVFAGKNNNEAGARCWHGVSHNGVISMVVFLQHLASGSDRIESSIKACWRTKRAFERCSSVAS